MPKSMFCCVAKRRLLGGNNASEGDKTFIEGTGVGILPGAEVGVAQHTAIVFVLQLSTVKLPEYVFPQYQA